MSEHNIVKVYLFKWMGENGCEYSPRHMWGTAEAIAGLKHCVLLPGTLRHVHRKLLEGGFLFEQVDSAYVEIEETAAFASGYAD